MEREGSLPCSQELANTEVTAVQNFMVMFWTSSFIRNL